MSDMETKCSGCDDFHYDESGGFEPERNKGDCVRRNDAELFHMDGWVVWLEWDGQVPGKAITIAVCEKCRRRALLKSLEFLK